MFSWFRRAAEEKRQERRVREIVRDIAYARGTTPRQMCKEATAAARAFRLQIEREQHTDTNSSQRSKWSD